MTVDGLIARARRPNPYADIQVELTSLCFHRLLPMVVSSGVIVVCVACVLAIHYKNPWFWQLAAIMLVPWAGRLAVVFLYSGKNTSQMTQQTASRWETAYGIATLIYVTGCAVVTISCAHQRDYVALNLTTLGTFAYANGISSRLSLRPWIAKLSGLIIMAGLAIAIVLSAEPITRYSVVLLAMYAYFYCEAIQVKYDTLVEQLRLKRKLHDLAEHDVLTGLANRRQFETRLAELCQLPGAFAVLFMDLDEFKTVNDTYGHPTGDALLQHVARRLQKVIADTDLLARLGGDEFAILQPVYTSADDPQTLAASIIRTVSAPYSIDGHTVGVGVSIGIQLSASERNDPRQLLSAADTALYLVKQSGKGSFRLAEPHSETKLILPEASITAHSPSSTQAVSTTGTSARSAVTHSGGLGPSQNAHHGPGKLFIGIRQEQTHLP